MENHAVINIMKMFLLAFRNLLEEEYLDSFISNPGDFPNTVMLFRDQTHLGFTADILRNY